jgi:hypothetical protein
MNGKLQLAKISINSDFKSFSKKRIANVDYQIYPCIMLVEGVHHGVGTDPVYYSPDVIASSAPQWNNMPVTIGHPVLSDGTHVLCNHDGTIRAEWQVGHVSNVRFEDGKLKADLYINTAICGQKQPELLTFLANGGQLDVSTGMLAADNGTAGNWNGEDFSAEIVEIIPDHLALLPNSTGACSWNDGCGVRFNQANGKVGEKVFVNSTDLTAQLEKIRSYVYGLDAFPKNGIGDRKEHWVKAIYSDYFIYRQEHSTQGSVSESKMLKQLYSLDTAGNIVLEGEPVEVVEEISYKIKAVNEGDVAKNKKAMEDKIMARAATPAEKAKCAEKAATPADKAKCKEMTVNQMIENADNAFTEDDRTWLMGLEDVQLSKLVANSEPKEVIVEKIVEKVVTNTATAPTDLNGYLQTAPPEVRAVLNAGLRELDNKRSSLIKIVMEQDTNKFTEDSLKEMSVETLESIVALIPQEPVRSFNGPIVPANIQMNEGGEEPYVPVTLSSVLGKK